MLIVFESILLREREKKEGERERAEPPPFLSFGSCLQETAQKSKKKKERSKNGGHWYFLALLPSF
jgi:hypothetical protein